MGAISGNVSYRRYWAPVDKSHADILAGLNNRRFRPLELDEDMTVGWCKSGKLDEHELEDNDVFLLYGHAIFSLRRDKWSLPASLVKSKVNELTEEWKRRRGSKTVPKDVKVEAKRRVSITLREASLPRPNSYDVIWDMDTGVIRFWAHSDEVNDVFLAMFARTFGVTPVPVTAYTLAIDDEDDATIEGIEALEPSSFVVMEGV